MNSWLAVWAPTLWRQRWGGLVALAVLVAVAGGVATGLAGGARRAESSFERFLEATGAPNLVAQVPLGDVVPGEPPAPPAGAMEVLDDLAEIPGVQSVTVESWWAIALYRELDPPGVVTAFANGTFAAAGQRADPVVVDGQLPGPDDPVGVIINEEAVDELGLAVGATMQFGSASPARLGEWMANDGNLPSTDALDGPRIEVRVAAVGRTQLDIGDERFPIVFFPEGFAAAQRDAIAHVEPFVSLRADPSRLDEVIAATESISAPYGLEILEAPSVGETVVPIIGVEAGTLRMPSSSQDPTSSTVGGGKRRSPGPSCSSTSLRRSTWRPTLTSCRRRWRVSGTSPPRAPTSQPQIGLPTCRAGHCGSLPPLPPWPAPRRSG